VQVRNAWSAHGPVNSWVKCTAIGSSSFSTNVQSCIPVVKQWQAGSWISFESIGKILRWIIEPAAGAGTTCVREVQNITIVTIRITTPVNRGAILNRCLCSKNRLSTVLLCRVEVREIMLVQCILLSAGSFTIGN